MEITGRIVADARTNKTKSGKEVTGFTLVQNDNFTTKAGEKKQVSTFFDCSYWGSSKVAVYLKKGCIVSVYGRIGMNVYKNMDGDAKGSLTFHVKELKFIAGTGGATQSVKDQDGVSAKTEDGEKDDLPF